MNAQDYHDKSPLLKCAMNDSRDTVRRLLSSKAAIERHLLDLSVQNMYGRSVLHHLVINRDKHNIKLFLNILGDSGDALNTVDCQGISVLVYCLNKNCMEEAEVILNHPKSRSKLTLENADSSETPKNEVARPCCTMQLKRVTLHSGASWQCWSHATCVSEMSAAKAGQNGMIRFWLAK